MIMKEYKYVEVKFEAKGVLFHSASEPKEIINKYAKEGYSYVGFIPTLIDAYLQYQVLLHSPYEYPDGHRNRLLWFREIPKYWFW